MGEVAQGSVTAFALIATTACAWVQMLGGRPGGRIFYRFFFPLLLTLTVFTVSILTHTFQLTKLLVFPYYLLVTHFGHTKFRERLFECVLYGLPTYAFGYVFLGTIQMLLCVLAAVIGHFFNQKPAPKVELLVNFLRVALIAYGVS